MTTSPMCYTKASIRSESEIVEQQGFGTLVIKKPAPYTDLEPASTVKDSAVVPRS